MTQTYKPPMRITPVSQDPVVDDGLADEGLYRSAFTRLGLVGIKNVADIGCGAGNFVKVMVKMKQRPEVYMGMDKHKPFIDTARRNFPDWKFILGDFFSEQIRKELDNYGGFLILEMLDFFEKDQELLADIPSGKPVVFSVRNFESPQALRWFEDRRAVLKRYSPFLEIKQLGMYKKSSGEAWFMGTSFRW